MHTVSSLFHVNVWLKETVFSRQPPAFSDEVPNIVVILLKRLFVDGFTNGIVKPRTVLQSEINNLVG